MKKHFITHTTQNYEHVTWNLARSIKNYSKNKLRCLSVELHKNDESLEDFQWSFLDRVHGLEFDRFVLYHGVDTTAKLRTLSCWKP
jgi:hypothetical protein